MCVKNINSENSEKLKKIEKIVGQYSKPGGVGHTFGHDFVVFYHVKWQKKGIFAIFVWVYKPLKLLENNKLQYSNSIVYQRLKHLQHNKS